MAARGYVRCELAGPAFDAAAHVLGHVQVSVAAAPVVRAASLFDARYVAWARAALPVGAIAPVARDAPLLGALLTRARDGHLLQALLSLHPDAHGAHSCASVDLDALDAGATRVDGGEQAHHRVVPWALEALRALAASQEELVELARCTLGLVASSYAGAWTAELVPGLQRARVEVASALGDAVDQVPSLAGARVALAHPLGCRGRAMPDRIVVGAPTAWSGVDAETSAAIAIHEHAVTLAAVLLEDPGWNGPGGVVGRWTWLEATALAAVPRRLRHGPVASAYRRHAAALDRTALVPPATVAGAVDGPPGDLVAHLVEQLGTPSG